MCVWGGGITPACLPHKASPRREAGSPLSPVTHTLGGGHNVRRGGTQQPSRDQPGQEVQKGQPPWARKRM